MLKRLQTSFRSPDWKHFDEKNTFFEKLQKILKINIFTKFILFILFFKIESISKLFLIKVYGRGCWGWSWPWPQHWESEYNKFNSEFNYCLWQKRFAWEGRKWNKNSDYSFGVISMRQEPKQQRCKYNSWRLRRIILRFAWFWRKVSPTKLLVNLFFFITVLVFSFQRGKSVCFESNPTSTRLFSWRQGLHLLQLPAWLCVAWSENHDSWPSVQTSRTQHGPGTQASGQRDEVWKDASGANGHVHSRFRGDFQRSRVVHQIHARTHLHGISLLSCPDHVLLSLPSVCSRRQRTSRENKCSSDECRRYTNICIWSKGRDSETVHRSGVGSVVVPRGRHETSQKCGFLSVSFVLLLVY